MARAQRVMCESCPTGRIDVGSPFCQDCGYPTMWASHDDRVQWEVGQWRRARGAAPAPERQLASVSSIAAAPPVPMREERASAPVMEATVNAAADASGSASLLDRLAGIVRRIREMFARSLGLIEATEVLDLYEEPPLEPLAEAPIEPSLKIAEPEPEPDRIPEPVAIVEVPAVVEPSAIEVPAVVVEIPVVEEAPAPVIEVLHKPPTPRKKPQRPTNKDLLRKTLDVLTVVEQRLEHLETEVSELATRNVFVAESEEIDRLPL